MEYVYLLASLPRLDLGAPAPLSSAELLRVSWGVVGDDHHAELTAIVEGRLEDLRTAEAGLYAGREIQLRNGLAQARARRAGAEYDDRRHPHAGYDVRCEEAVSRALALDDPAARELALDRFRWSLLDEVAALPEYGVQALFAYAFKLRLVEKWAAVSDESGLRALAETVDRDLAGRVP